MIRIDEIPADIGVIERIAARDERALGELYDRYSRLLFGLILRILPDRTEAEATLQEVFVLVWTEAQSYTTALGSPAAWLVGRARTRAIARRRAEAVGRRTAEAPPASDVRTSRESDEQRAALRALDVLSPDERILIEQAFYCGLTETELAERFDLPLGTIKTRIRTGMLTLRQHLSQTVIQQ